MVKLPQPHGAAVHKGEVLEYTEAKQAQPERAPLSDAEITQLMNDWGVVTTKHRTDKGEPFQSVELSFDRLSALLHAAHGIKQGGQHA